MTPEEARQNVEEIRREKLDKDSPGLRAALKLLAEELNTKETHFILELLQNAEDNEYDNRQPELSVGIEADDPTRTPSANGCLVVLNNEVGFRVANVRSLCSVGQSTKNDRNQGYIGEKGIGFKSVFRVTDSPHIFSNGFQFRFQIPTETEGFGYILPHWVEAVPPKVKEGSTAILLPLQPGRRDLIARQLSKIAPETLLFLKKLKRLHLGEGRSISSDGKVPLVRLCSNGEEALYFVHSEPCEKPGDFTELDEIEQAPAPRPPTGPTPPPTDAPLPVAASSQASSAERTAVAQATGSAASQATPTPPSQRSQETPRSDTPTASQEQEPQTQSASGVPAELHDASATTADFVPVRAHTRSRSQRQPGQQSRDNRRDAASGLTTASTESKVALEQCGRDFATRKLQGMGYTVTPMGQRSPGYDLLAVRPGHTLKVEVKAHAGEVSSVFITQRVWEEHLRTRGIRGQAWELWNVENLLKCPGNRPSIQRVRYIPKSAMKESGYWIDLSQCSEEPPR